MAEGLRDFSDVIECLKYDELIMEKPEKNNQRVLRGAREKHQMVLKNVYVLLECPVCTTLISPPIHQCPNGHILCSICNIRVQNCCPICHVGMGSIRCSALEKLLEPLEISYDCPYTGFECSVTCNIPELVMHLKDDHNVDILDGINLLNYDDDAIMEKKGKPNTRASIDAREKHQMVLSNVYKLLECPMCASLMLTPVHQCQNGHILCSICKIRVQNWCWICGTEMGSIRCLALEKVAEPLEIPYDCPYDGSECSITGNIPDLVRHLKDDHNVEMHDGYKFSQDFTHFHPTHEPIQKYFGTLAVFNCYGETLCYHFQVFNLGMTPCYIAFLRFMGEETKAKKFCYSLKLDGNGRKLTWQGVPRSIRDNHSKVRDDLDGLVIPQNLAFFFSDVNKQNIQFQIKLRIWIQQ